MDDQSEYPPDVASFYVYKLNHVLDRTFEIEYIKTMFPNG